MFIVTEKLFDLVWKWPPGPGLVTFHKFCLEFGCIRVVPAMVENVFLLTEPPIAAKIFSFKPASG